MKRAAALLLLFACARPGPEPIEPPLAPATRADVRYLEHIQPLLERRCVVCHSCYNAPCQLNLQSFDGVERGANPMRVYEPTRVEAASPTRMFIDANSSADWQTRFGFFPVIARTGDRDRNLSESILYHLIEARRADGGTPKLDVDDSHSCPRDASQVETMIANDPAMGMPYGFPPLSPKEKDSFERWLKAGAPGPPERHESAERLAEISQWENWFNQQAPKAKLSARYVYEHLFLAHLFFEKDTTTFYRVVRSRTAAPKAIDEIASVRPFDDPGGPFFYRLKRVEETIVAKTHVPYALSALRLQRLDQLFLAPKWPDEKPGFPEYGTATAANPFVTFAAIPARSRYQFLLDDSYYHVRTFIHGPVCKGQVALNVIDEHFWIFFLDPGADASVTDPKVLDATQTLLQVPADNELGIYEKFKVGQLLYLKKRQELAAKSHEPGRGLDSLWRGVGQGAPVLTVYRHFDSATVSYGALGGQPKTTWVMDYPIFERMYYDLVAGFNVWGDLVHQIATRRYMDNLRVEAEDGFLRFMPKASRVGLRQKWYRGKGVEKYIALTDPLIDDRETRVTFSGPATDDALRIQFLARVGAAAARVDSQEPELSKLAHQKLPFVQRFPDVALVHVTGEHEQVYSLVRNKEHLNTAFMFLEDKYRDPANDELQLLDGFVGSYPNFIFRVPAKDLPAFVSLLLSTTDASDGYSQAVDLYGVKRTDPDFWKESDWLNDQFGKVDPVHAGILDLTRYQR